MPHYHSLTELYKTRLREFYRQPARIFWVYGFPTIMAIGLGLAFRSRPPETIAVTAVDPSGLLPASAARPPDPSHGRPGLRFEPLPEAEARHRLMTGKTPLVVEATTADTVIYRYDPTRPE